MDNLIFGSTGVITADVTSFLFTDGVAVTFSQANSAGLYFFDIGTAADGSITTWEIEADTPVGPGQERAATANAGQGAIFDSSEALSVGGNIPNEGEVDGAPGKWVSSVVATPEPSTWLLLGTGLLGLIVVGRRMQIGEARRTGETMC